MHSGSRFANGMQPPSVAQYGILSVKIVISIRALSGIVERPHRSEHDELRSRPPGPKRFFLSPLPRKGLVDA